MSTQDKSDFSFKDQLGTVLSPKNVLKTIASQVPGASAGVEILNQIEGKRTEKRIEGLEEADVEMLTKLRNLEAHVVRPPVPTLKEWPFALHAFLQRNVEFAVVHHPPDRPGTEYVLPCANGCAVGDDYVLTCSEGIALAQDVAKHKRGKVVILIGLTWYEFMPEPVDEATGLVLCKITSRDQKHWETANKLAKEHNLPEWVRELPSDAPKWTVTPWMGQEVGFIIASDSENNMRQAEWTPVEFGTAVISHFRLPQERALKSFVTVPFAGRIRQYGSPVFSRDAELLGIISGVEQHEYDVGRRAVVKTLLGMPRFTKPKLKRNTT